MSNYTVYDTGCNISKWDFDSLEEASSFCNKLNSMFVLKSNRRGLIYCNSYQAPNKPEHGERFVIEVTNNGKVI